MKNNVVRQDVDRLIAYLQRQGDPVITQASEVRAFEAEWSKWLGVEHSLFVSSGSAANFVTMAALRHLEGPGEVVVAPLTWISDIASILYCGLTPRFVDIDPRTLSMDVEQTLRAIGPRTRAVFLTHILGYNGITRRLLDGLAAKKVPLIEDACESHGATFEGRKVGTFGLASNFSFYYAHHMTTGEGGMISTRDDRFHQVCRMLRSHGMIREMTDTAWKERLAAEHPDLDPSFIFACPGFNARNTELGAVLGRSQLGRLDANVESRTRNLRVFLDGLDPDRFFTDFAVEGSSNYAFTLVLREPDEALRDALVRAFREAGVEYRRGLSGGGNQLRQPYLARFGVHEDPKAYPRLEHVHFFGFYVGNWPDLPADEVRWLTDLVNGVAARTRSR